MSKKPRAPYYKLEIPGDTGMRTELMKKIKVVRVKLFGSSGQSVNHADILNTVLDHWILDNAAKPHEPQVTTHRQATQAQTVQGFYMMTKSSLGNIVALAEDHAKYCSSRMMIQRKNVSSHTSLSY